MGPVNSARDLLFKRQIQRRQMQSKLNLNDPLAFTP